MIEIYRLAAEAGIRVCPHRGSEPYAIHAIAALDPRPLAEAPRDWFGCLQGASPIANGSVTVPDRPGFGVTVESTLWDGYGRVGREIPVGRFPGGLEVRRRSHRGSRFSGSICSWPGR